MALNFTGQTNTDFELIEAGDYEVILTAEWAKKFNNPDELYINCKFKVRDDVEQPYGGRIVFDAIYQSQTTKDFNKSKINGILGAIPNAKLDFNDYDELIQYLNGQPMMVYIDVEEANQFHQKDKNVIKYLSYGPTQKPLGGAKVESAATDVDFSQPVNTNENGFLPF